jgi:hypothetical protein
MPRYSLALSIPFTFASYVDHIDGHHSRLGQNKFPIQIDLLTQLINLLLRKQEGFEDIVSVSL